jgi:hypothetical protein
MSKRLQVLLPDEELEDIRRVARSESVSVGEWVRRVLREARTKRPLHDSKHKLEAIRRAAGHCFPTADIDQMLREIEQGYQK